MKKIFLFLVVFSLLSLASSQVFAASLQITTKSLPNGTFGIAYTQQIQAQGGTPPYTFSIKSGALPSGLNLSSDGKISGTPTKEDADKKSEFFVRVIDKDSPTPVDKKFSIFIEVPQLKITNPTGDSITSGTPGEYYEFTFKAEGGIPPYSWENPQTTGRSNLSSLGLQLSSSGRITGTPTKSGNFRFAVRVTGDPVVGFPLNGVFPSFDIEIKSVPFEITTPNLPSGEINKPYTATLFAHGGTPPYSWSIAVDSLPDGLKLSGSTISGTPTKEGNFSFTVLVKDAAGEEKIKRFSITIIPIGTSCRCSDGTTCDTCKAGSPPLYCDGTTKTLIDNPTCAGGAPTPPAPPPGPPGEEPPQRKLEVAWPRSPLGTELTGESLTNLIKYLYEWGIGIGGFLAFIALIIAGFKYLTSAGNAGMMKDAMDRIKSAGLGLILLLASVLILNTINPQLTDISMPPPEQLIKSGWDFNLQGQQLSIKGAKAETCGGALLFPEINFGGTPPRNPSSNEKGVGIGQYKNLEVKSIKIFGGCSVTLYDWGDCTRDAFGPYYSKGTEEETRYDNIEAGGVSSFGCVKVSQM